MFLSDVRRKAFDSVAPNSILFVPATKVTRCTRRCVRAKARDLDVLADLGHFSQLLEETERFCGCG